MKTPCCILLAALAAAGCGGDDANAITPITWQATFGFETGAWGASVHQTADGQYIVAGMLDVNLQDYLLLKVDQHGSKIWDTGFTGPNRDEPESVRETTDGGYIIAGSTESVGGAKQFWVVKTDVAGRREWDRTLGYSNEVETAHAVRQTRDGGYVIVGSTSHNGSNVFLVKLDAAGNTQWVKDKGYSDRAETGNSVEQTNDGGFVIVGSLDYGQNGSIYLLKLDEWGANHWFTDKRAGTSGTFGESIQQTADGGYIVLANTMVGETPISQVWNPYLVKTNAVGNTLWESFFSMAESTSTHSIRLTSDGGYVIAGTHGGDALLLKVDAEGHQVWRKLYGGELNARGKEAQETADGGFILVGDTQLANGDAQVMLVKTDANGNVAGVPSR